MAELSIGEVARRAGMHTSALRYYEGVRLLPAPRRVNGRRRYDTSILPRIALIQRAQQMGLTLREIRDLCIGLDNAVPPSTLWHTLAERKLPEVDAQLARITTTRRILEKGLECACVALEQCGLLLARTNDTSELPHC
ncbi:MAG TPA: MerR family transcriptional regulator [Ktedonobacterales bacterium]|jgi:MerR family redox-sensitive transcriptional activator SoxR|nr:MerR family transcriptional regulator [Ktedonobacterales bacterium]